MVSQFTGMDIAAVRQLSQQLASKATEIQSIAQQLTGQLNSTSWVGNDQQRFLSDWTSVYQPALTKVVEGLNAASQVASKNAQEQETASNA